MVQQKQKIKVDYRRCKPDSSESGICFCVEVCPVKLWRQEDRYEFPHAIPGFCQKCGKCIEACPQKAVHML